MLKKYNLALIAAAVWTVISMQVISLSINLQVKETANKKTLISASDYQKRPLMQVDFDGEGNIVVQPIEIKSKEEIVQATEVKADNVYAANVNKPKTEISRGGSISNSAPKKASTNKSADQGSKGGQTNNVSQNSKAAQAPSINYSEKELFYRLVSAEAAGEPFEGMLAVATVIMNRVKSPKYPNTITGVIMDKNWGYQFTPVADGRINEPYSTEAKRAVDMVLAGYRSFGPEVLYYLNPKKSTNSWIPKSKTYFKTIGNQDFYY